MCFGVDWCGWIKFCGVEEVDILFECIIYLFMGFGFVVLCVLGYGVKVDFGNVEVVCVKLVVFYGGRVFFEMMWCNVLCFVKLVRCVVYKIGWFNVIFMF